MKSRNWRVSGALGGVLTAASLAGCGAGIDDAPDVGSRREAAVSNRNFGAHCTGQYEAAWLTAVGWTNCDRFVSEIAKEATREFYFDLNGKQFYWHDGGDGADNSLEDVDLFYSNTHGSASSSDFVSWAMYNVNTVAKSNSMRLGDERRGLSIFATHAAYTAEWTTADGDRNGVWDTWQRWDSVFFGGLRAHLGSHGLVFINGSEDLGKIFAQHLNAGYSLRDAWYFGLRASSANNDVAALYSGTSSADCDARRAGMSWDNFDVYPRLTSPGFLCATRWDDV